MRVRTARKVKGVAASLRRLADLSRQYRSLQRPATLNPARSSGLSGQQRHRAPLQEVGRRPAGKHACRLVSNARAVLHHMRRWWRVCGDLPDNFKVSDDLLDEDVDVGLVLISGGAGCGVLFFLIAMQRTKLLIHDARLQAQRKTASGCRVSGEKSSAYAGGEAVHGGVGPTYLP